MPSSPIFLESRNRAYVRAKRDLEANEQYVVNNEAKARKDKKMNLRVAQSNLISIVPLNANTTQYVFNVLDSVPNQGNAGLLSEEIRLKQQDVFFTSSIGFFLVAYAPVSYPPLRFQFMTYPTPSLQGVLGIGDAAALMGIWTAGKLDVKVNGETVTPSWWLQKHLVINQTQSNVAGTPINPYWDQINYAEDGYQVVEPNWIVNGGNNNLYTVNYNNDWSLVFGGTNAANTYGFCIAMVWDGWLAQNASSIMNNAPAKP